MKNKNLRRLSILVTAQTAYHLDNLARMAGYREIGARTYDSDERT